MEPMGKTTSGGPTHGFQQLRSPASQFIAASATTADFLELVDRFPAGTPLATSGGVALIQNPLVDRVLPCVIDVHRVLGPGLLERAYKECLAYELAARGISFQTEVAVPVVYKDVRLACGFRVDFVVENQLVLEIKSVEEIARIHEAQIITYLKLMRIKQGLLINFNSRRVMDQVKSVLV